MYLRIIIIGLDLRVMYYNATSHIPVPCSSGVSSSSPGSSNLFSGSRKCSNAVAPTAFSTTYIKAYLPRCSTIAFADPSTFSISSTFLYPQNCHTFLMSSSGIFSHTYIVQVAHNWRDGAIGCPFTFTGAESIYIS